MKPIHKHKQDGLKDILIKSVQTDILKEQIKLIENVEQSQLALFLLQLQIITLETSNLIFLSKFIVNSLLIKTCFEKNIAKTFSGVMRIENPFPYKMFESLTLGNLIEELKIVPLSSDDKKELIIIIDNLIKYNTKRNNLIHKLLIKYKNIEDVYDDAFKINLIGKQILLLIEQFKKNINLKYKNIV